jgi:uncharacterized protein YgiM (DUF1202 family)
MSKHGIVNHLYRSTSTDPIVMKVGDRLQVEDRQTEFAGWVWCLHSSGKSSWVPENFLQREGDTAHASRDYDATELTVEVGQIIEILDEEAEWYWCQTEAGDYGWVPVENVAVG